MVRITRQFTGVQKVYDKDDKKDICHAISARKGYSPKQLYKKEQAVDSQTGEKAWMDEEKTKPKMINVPDKMQPGKSFEVKDEAYVLAKYPAILEKA